jgi:hypothetical protein
MRPYIKGTKTIYQGERGEHRYGLAVVGMIVMLGMRQRVKAMKDGVHVKDLPPGKRLTETHRGGGKRSTERERDGPACLQSTMALYVDVCVTLIFGFRTPRIPNTVNMTRIMFLFLFLHISHIQARALRTT